MGLFLLLRRGRESEASRSSDVKGGVRTACAGGGGGG